MKTALIKPILDFKNELGELKQGVLLFDIVGIPRLDGIILDIKNENPSDIETHIINEFEFLQDQGYIFNATFKDSFLEQNSPAMTLINEAFFNFTKAIEKVEDLELRQIYDADFSALFRAYILNNQEKKLDYFSVPYIRKLTNLNSNITKADVINIVIEKMPLPDDLTPWENIIEFKTNKDNLGKLAGLNVWMNKAISSGSSASELKDELDYLLYQYRTSLELHKIKFNIGTFQRIIVGTAELIENVAHLRFSNIAKGLFSAHQEKVELLQAELTAPGKEIAYIYQAQKKFD